MKKFFIVVTVIFLALIIGLFIYQSVLGPDTDDSSTHDEDESTEEILDKEEDEDEVAVDEEEVEDIEYDYFTELLDVTNGNTILGVSTGGNSSGISQALFNDNLVYMLEATFSDLPDPRGTDFYEGWIVRKEPFSVISTGAAVKTDGVYINTYSADENLTDHDFYVLTLEPDDGNPEPADHILEGTMTLK